MKLAYRIVALFISAIALNATAQTVPPAPPAPPAPPTTTETSSTTETTSNISVITQNGDYGQGGNTSYSVSNSNDEYTVKSRFPKNRYPAAKEFLMQEMGTKGMQANGDTITWELDSDEEVYKIKLSEKRLNIYLNKQIASSAMLSKFEDLGTVLRSIISGGNERQDISRLERDADRARRDAERMQREAQRLRRMSVREAERLQREAQRLSQRANNLSVASKRNGGIDGYVRTVLKEPTTTYTGSYTDSNIWKWPAMQEALLARLAEDKLIRKGEDIVFVKDEKGVYVNGQKLSTAAWSSYNKLFRSFDYGRMTDFSFYMKDNHIAIIDGAIDFEDLLDELEDAGLVKMNKGTSKILINGDTVVVNGIRLSQKETAKWNAILHNSQIIPAPGKSIEIGDDYASLGYKFGKTNLGLWISRD